MKRLKGDGKMKCYYCHRECEGFAFEQEKLLVIAHKSCAVAKVETDGKLAKNPTAN